MDCLQKTDSKLLDQIQLNGIPEEFLIRQVEFVKLGGGDEI